MTHGIFYCGHILEYDRHLEREKEFVCYDCGSNDVDVLIVKDGGHVRRYIYDKKDKEILMGFQVWECKNCQQHPENCSPCGRTGYHGIAFRKQDLRCISYNTHRLNGRNTVRYRINRWLNGRKREELGAAFDPLVMRDRQCKVNPST